MSEEALIKSGYCAPVLAVGGGEQEQNEGGWQLGTARTRLPSDRETLDVSASLSRLVLTISSVLFSTTMLYHTIDHETCSDHVD